MTRFVLSSIVLLACAVSAQTAPSMLPEGKQWKLVWNDEFDGTQLDRTKWDYRLHIMHTRHNTFTNEGAVVKDGLLHLNRIEVNGDFYSPHLQTGYNYMDRPPEASSYTKKLTWPIAEFKQPLFMHKYGYYEARCKLQQHEGWWSAFWLQAPAIGSTPCHKQSGVEVDIMECFTTNNAVLLNLHWDGYGKDHKSAASGKRLLNDRNAWHTYGVEWTPTNYVFYIDGKPSWTNSEAVSQTEQFILISTECNGYRSGGKPKLPAGAPSDAFIIDYVRVYDEVTK